LFMKEISTATNQKSKWKRYFRGWNLIINFSIAFLPAIFVTAILLEVGVPRGLADALPIIIFVYLTGIVREKLSRRTKQKTDLKTTKDEISNIRPNKKSKGSRVIKWVSISTVLLIVGGWFYWYEVRPANIRSLCSQIATEKATLKKEDQKPNLLDKYYDRPTEQKDIFYPEKYKTYYDICLNEHGLR